MRQPKENARRCSGGLRDAIAGFRLANDTPTPPGWIYVRGDSEALDPVPFDRSIGLLVRIDCIIGPLELVRGCAHIRTIITVIHRGEEVRVRADDDPMSLARVIESRRIGGAR
jgi:hypothetical protein